MSTEFLIPETDKELREANMVAVRAFVDSWSHKRNKDELTKSDDFCGGLYSTPNGMVPHFPKGNGAGKADIEDFDARMLKLYRDFYMYDAQIYQTVDPSLFLITCKGRGHVIAPQHGMPYYKMDFFHIVQIKNGELAVWKEYIDICDLFRQFGLKVPVISRPERKIDYLTKAGYDKDLEELK